MRGYSLLSWDFGITRNSISDTVLLMIPIEAVTVFREWLAPRVLMALKMPSCSTLVDVYLLSSLHHS